VKREKHFISIKVFDKLKKGNNSWLKQYEKKITYKAVLKATKG